MEIGEIRKRYKMWLDDDPYVDADNLMINMFHKIEKQLIAKEELERQLIAKEEFIEFLERNIL